MRNVYIIAEAGVNHNGDLQTALSLVKEAKRIGADCVKFQTFKTENIVTKKSPKASYQLNVTDAKESQFDMLKKLELGKADFRTIKAFCDEQKIDFMSTPYSEEDIDMLADLGVDAFKIASGQLVELGFLQYAASFKRRMIISTGMANLAEVFHAVQAIRSVGNDDIVVLQCNTDYPSKIEDANLRAMKTMRDSLGVVVGYSDHVPNNYACYGAVALGAKVIEKHFTLNRGMEGPDHSTSLEPDQFEELINAIRNIELALGTGIKIPSESEKRNTYGMRRSVVARQDIKAGTVITKEHLAVKRPYNGMSPNEIDRIVGATARTDIKADEPLTYSVIRIA